MPTEHYRVDGSLCQGYYCSSCGEPCGLYAHMMPYATGRPGERKWRCKPNRELVYALQRANPRPGEKPHFSRPADVVAVIDFSDYHEGLPRFYDHWVFGEKGPMLKPVDGVYELTINVDPTSVKPCKSQ